MFPLILALAAGGSPAAPQVAAPELRAVVVLRFLGFVEWPAGDAGGPAPFVICVPAQSPDRGALGDLVAGQVHGQRPLQLRVIGERDSLSPCQVLVVAANTTARQPLLGRAATLPILTIGDYPEFLDEGGIIGMRMVERRIRFDIDAAAARRAGLRVSSRLLQLASNVRGTS